MGLRRGGHDDLTDPRHPRGYHRHEHGGKQRGAAAGDVDPHPGQGAHQLPQHPLLVRAYEPPAGFLLVEGLYAGPGGFQGAPEFAVQLVVGLAPELFGDLVGRVAVEALAPGVQGRVAPFLDFAHDPLDRFLRGQRFAEEPGEPLLELGAHGVAKLAVCKPVPGFLRGIAFHRLLLRRFLGRGFSLSSSPSKASVSTASKRC